MTGVQTCCSSDLASAEIVLEGVIHPGEMALEGPYGDHTGYYNEQAEFPVFTIERITMRRDPIYHSTYTGKPPDEPAVVVPDAPLSSDVGANTCVARDVGSLVGPSVATGTTPATAHSACSPMC